jgi:cytochrome c556
MTPVRLFVAAALLLAASGTFAEPAPPDSAFADAREPAPRTKAERAYILEQMRLLVESIQAITEGLATDHMEDVIEAAAARGLHRNANDPAYPASMKAKETPLWKQMGGGTRRGFDELADAAKNGATKEKQLAILAETMKNCVACHQTYRLVAAPEP